MSQPKCALQESGNQSVENPVLDEGQEEGHFVAASCVQEARGSGLGQTISD